MIIMRAAKDTLTAVEMMHGDSLELRLLDGRAAGRTCRRDGRWGLD